MRKTIFIIIAILLATAVGFVLSPSKKTKASAIPQKSEIQKPIVLPKPAPEKNLTAEATSNPYLQQLLADYEQFFDKAIAARQAPGAAVVIIKDSTVIFLKGFGLRQAGTQDSVNVNTVFRLGSVSKCITTSLTGTLVKDQLFKWDDKVIKYLPGFALKLKPNTDSLRIRHILSHTMGLPYHAFTDRVEARVSLDTLLFHLRDLDLIAAPGKVYSYQNVGFSLIEKVIQSITGKSYEQVLTEKIFKPLQMKDASASYERIIENANVAQPHYYSKQGWRAAAISDTYYNVAPAGGVNASIADMALWLKALLGARPDVFSEQTVSEMLTPQVRAISKNRNFWKWQRTRASYYAMGWRVLTFKNDTIDYHGGYVNGYRSEVALDRKNKMAICVLVNAAGNLSDQSIPHFFITRSRYLTQLKAWENQHKTLLAKR